MTIENKTALPMWQRSMTRASTPNLAKALRSGSFVTEDMLHADHICFADDDDDIEIEGDGDDDDNGGGGFQPDDAARAWHEAEVKGLKGARSKALAAKKKHEARADTAEARVAELEIELEGLKAKLGDAAYDIDERLAKLAEFESGKLKEADIDEEGILERGRKGAERKYEPQLKAKDKRISDLESENGKLKNDVHEYRYTGRLKSSLNGVIKPGYEVPALATIKTMAKFEDDELIVVDVDGEPAVDDKGHHMSVEDFMTDVFPKRFPEMCVKDNTIQTNGPGSKGGKKVANPFMPDTFNSTTIARLIAKDPAAARKLARAAGVEPSEYGL